ncbi:S24 family peptidase [Paenirhodobacter enshiensis]|uniref:S24 family peptidase n=1 Tax=Paenirhodobacter enshiensis TaxID=1105367 RepID=UPI003FA31D3A
MSKKPFATRVIEAMQAKGINAMQLHRATGVSYNVINKLKQRPQSSTSADNGRALASFLGLEWDEEDDSAARPSSVEDVPLISWVSAGQLADQASVTSLAEFPSLMVAELPRGNWIALRVQGTSMNKLSPPDSIIVIDLDDKRLIPGKCYVVCDETGAATYKAYDPTMEPPFVPRSYIEQEVPKFIGGIRIVGRVHRTMLDL